MAKVLIKNATYRNQKVPNSYAFELVKGFTSGARCNYITDRKSVV